MEQIPELEVGAVLRIHNMRVEKWNGVFDGRVYSGSSVTSVLGDAGEPVKPMCYKQGPDMKWVEADNRKVEDLRRWWADKQTSKKTAETSISSLDAAETLSLKCRVADLYSAPSGLVLRLEDGTQCNLRTVEFSGDFDTQTDEVSLVKDHHGHVCNCILCIIFSHRLARRAFSSTCGWTLSRADKSERERASDRAAWCTWRGWFLSMLARRTMLS